MPLNTLTFNFYSLLFKPVKKHNQMNSVDILKKVLHYVTPVNLGNKVHVVDRHQNRKESNPRELFIDAVVYDMKEMRYKCRIAVIRSGKAPMLKPHDTYKLVPLDQLGNVGTLAEVTHFYIDISKNKPYICCEYNFFGPRISDIQFYLRNVAHTMLELAKETTMEMYLDVSIDKLLEQLNDVLNFELKIEPQSLDQIETSIKNHYFTGISSFSRLLGTRSINIKAFFDVYEDDKMVKTTNEGTNLIKRLLRSINNNSTDLDAFKNFSLEYTDESDEKHSINLIKNQKGFQKEVDTKTLVTNRKWYELVKDEIDKFISER